MRIYADKLADHLSHGLKPAYLLFGNEPLLIQESRLAIEKQARAERYEERHRFSADASLDWNEVYDCVQAMSLFSARQIIEIEVPESGLGVTGSKELLSISELLHPDILLMVTGSKLTKAQENAKWFKSLTQNGCWVSCLTPELQRLPQFVQIRCRQLGLKPDPEAVQMLAQWHEGNLFALVQSLEKLALLYPDGNLTLVRLEESLNRQNHYTPFHWVDAVLEGKAARAQRILRQLESEGTEAIILMRSIQRELLLLLQMQSLLSSMTLNAVFDKYRVWQSKRSLYSAALNRLPAGKIRQLLRILAQAELLAKTQYEEPVWPLLHQLSLEAGLPQLHIPVRA